MWKKFGILSFCVIFFLNGESSSQSATEDSTEDLYGTQQSFLAFLKKLENERKPFFFSACYLGEKDHHYHDENINIEESIFALLVSEFITPRTVEENPVLPKDTIILERVFLIYEDGLGQGLLSAEIKQNGQYGYYESVAGLWTHAYASLLYDELKGLPFSRRNNVTWKEMISVARNFECNVDYSSDRFPLGKDE